MSLLKLLDNAPVVVMLGMCKNAGKTTAMTHLIREYADAAIPLALTSIGRDGERKDLVTGTDKPPIYVFESMLIATAEQLLPFCDVSREILALPEISTSLGRIVVLRAKSDGFVQLAGPAMVEQLSLLRDSTAAQGAKCLLVDGALSRRSPAAGAAEGACILSTGASLNRDMDTVVWETAYAAKLLSLPRMDYPESAVSRFTVFRNREPCPCETVEELLTASRQAGERVVALSGGLTETQAASLLRGGIPLEGLILLAQDGSRFLMKRATGEKLEARGAMLRVRAGSRLAAITVNPVSAGGWSFDGNAFLDRLRLSVSVPVFNLGRTEWN